MHWDGYTVFSVLSGIALVLMALGEGKVSTRLWLVAGGAAFVIYGIYVAQQTSGTFVFPVWIFVIPFVAAGRFAIALIHRSRRSGQAVAPHPAPPGPQQPAAPVPGPPRHGAEE